MTDPPFTDEEVRELLRMAEKARSGKSKDAAAFVLTAAEPETIRRLCRALLEYGPADCDCYHCCDKLKAERGKPPCEYANHHCIGCHERGLCSRACCRALTRTPADTGDTP